jgi:glycosyltransferase involved in cell wall biosynthesis
VPFTYEVQDMGPETLAATNMVRAPRVLAAVGRYCLWAYHEAAGVRVISRGFQKNLVAKGVAPDKVGYVPNWVDTDFYLPCPRDEGLQAELGASGRFNVVYAGTIGPAQGLGTVLDAAERLRDRPEVQFILAGEGLEQASLRQAAERRGLSSVRFIGRRPMTEMPRLYALADVLLVHLINDPLFKITVPHKTLTYLAAGRPVLAAVEGDVAELVREHEAGLTCAPANAEALAAAVVQLAAMPAEARERLGRNGRLAAERVFSRTKVIRDFAAFLESARERGASRSVSSSRQRQHKES